jgi:hypothetical protein
MRIGGLCVVLHGSEGLNVSHVATLSIGIFCATMVGTLIVEKSLLVLLCVCVKPFSLFYFL